MAISSSKKHLSLQLLAFITTYLTLLHTVNSAGTEVVQFLFNDFNEDTQKDLILQGDASISNNVLKLTKVDNNGNPLSGSVGRALYSEPIPLWDSSTGEAASIFTSFIFLISSPSSNNPPPADGLTFFLASPDTTIPPNSGGAFLGLFSASNALNNSRKELVGFKASSDQVVAVEFDTYPNVDLGVDPDYKHVGIDVNSIKSEVTEKWDWQNGQPVAVTIFYDPYAKRLRVFASYPDGSTPVDFTHDIDLTTVLPERVRVGFSGSTGLYSQVNNIIGWSFGSILGKSYVVKEGGIASVV